MNFFQMVGLFIDQSELGFTERARVIGWAQLFLNMSGHGTLHMAATVLAVMGLHHPESDRI